MDIRRLSLLCLLMAWTPATVWAQESDNDDNYNPPLTDYDADAPARQQEGEYERPQSPNDDEEEDPVYKFPQAHEFEQPVIVGADQLRLYRGYWQPGGYQVRDGSPFFNSVPGAPPRGPIAGGGGDSAYNPMESGGAAAQNGYAVNGYNQNAYNQPAYGQNMQGQNAYTQNGYGQNGYAQNGYTQDSYVQGYGPQGNYGYGAYGNNGYGAYDAYGYQNGGGYANGAGGGGAGGAGGAPYNYHFGPGYYRSSEYGHFRFPYYSYRRPWFHPGFAGFNRDVNIPW